MSRWQDALRRRRDENRGVQIGLGRSAYKIHYQLKASATALRSIWLGLGALHFGKEFRTGALEVASRRKVSRLGFVFNRVVTSIGKKYR